ncbi:MAG: histidine phosphatase family protein [Bacteroidales bacterium]|nr:histidine phosphatase family protein [Bacteroidales bacterium]
MQRKLFIVRHGKSSWESIVNDIDRPLTERGVKNSYEIANRLKNKGLIPESIFSSPAARALHTAIIMSQVWELDEQNIFIRNQLYLPDIEDITEMIFEIPDRFSSVAIYGHNPGFTYFSNIFMKDKLEKLPTAGTLVITFELDSWNNISNGKVIDTCFDSPKRTL